MNKKTLTVSLSPKHEKFIESQVQSGKYPSADEMIALALELLEESIYLENSDNKRNYEKWLEETRKKLVVGLEQADRGQLTDGKVVLAKLREKIRKAHENQA